jgi:glycosyltransferase involved in cell wall biosynthesis
MSIDIVVPARDAAAYLPVCIRSVLRQTRADWRMAVVDDGSSDGTAAAAFAFADPRIAILSSPGRGVSAARNAGFRPLDGETVLFLDADDWLAGDALERLARALAADPGAIAAAAPYARVARDGRIGPAIRPPTGDLARRLGVRNVFLNGGHVLIRRAAIQRTGGFDQALDFGEDWEFWARLARLGRFAADPSPHPALYALDRPDGAFHARAGEPDAYRACLSAIHAPSAPPRAARAEAAWEIAKAWRRRGAARECRAWAARSLLTAPSPRRAARLAWSYLARLTV